MAAEAAAEGTGAGGAAAAAGPPPPPPPPPAAAPLLLPAHSRCLKCDGSGASLGRLSKKAYHVYKKAKEAAEAKGDEPPPPPKRPTNPCAACTGTGLALRKQPPSTLHSTLPPQPRPPLPPALVVIVGGGIGGCALALALQHRGMSVAVYERDATFGTRAQGYGLTMQQGARTLKQLGFGKLGAYGVSSTQVTKTQTLHYTHLHLRSASWCVRPALHNHNADATHPKPVLLRHPAAAHRTAPLVPARRLTARRLRPLAARRDQAQEGPGGWRRQREGRRAALQYPPAAPAPAPHALRGAGARYDPLESSLRWLHRRRQKRGRRWRRRWRGRWRWRWRGRRARARSV